MGDGTPASSSGYQAGIAADQQSALLVPPSEGPRGHADGNCRPCVWYWKPESCTTGLKCNYCHLCDPEVLKKAMHARKVAKRAMLAGHVSRYYLMQPRAKAVGREVDTAQRRCAVTGSLQ